MINPTKPDYQNTPASERRGQFVYRPSDPTAPPAVTIITPFYNAGPIFYETTLSVYRQSLQQWEWVIVNDGSTTPEALKLLDEYRQKDPRIRVVDHPKNKGLSAARNTGFREARTEYVFQLDTDDLIEPTTLEKMLWHLHTHPKAAFTTGFTVGFGSIEYLWRNGFHSGSLFLTENPVTATCLLRKSIHQAIGGYDEGIRGGMEDWDFWLKAAAHGHWGTTIPEFLDWYRRRDTGREHWDNITQRDKFDKFLALLRRRYQKLWDGEFPVVGSTPAQVSLSLTASPPLANQLAKTNRRLLLIAPHLELGGADKFNLNLIRQLQEAEGWEVSVATTRRSNDPWLHEFEGLTPDTFVLPHFLELADQPQFLRYLIASRQPDAVCLSNSRLGYQLLPYLRAHFPELPLVDYLHMEEEAGGGYPPMSINYQSQLAKTVVASQHLKDFMTARGGNPNKIEVCYINNDNELWSRAKFDAPALAQKWQVDSSRPVLLYAGRICDQKQPLVFANVIQQLARKYPNFTALVAGDGPDMPELKSFVDQQGLNQVRLLGAVSSDGIAELLALSDIFFLPSRWEGIALTIYEAMAMEVVPVGADVGGQRELVTPACGILVRRGSNEVANYTDALLKLLKAPELRKRMAAAARQRVCEHFGIKDLGRRMTALFSTARNALTQGQLPPAPSLEVAALHASEVLEQVYSIEAAETMQRQQRNMAAHVKHMAGWQAAVRTAQTLIKLDQPAAALTALQDGVKEAMASGAPEVELSARTEIAVVMAPLDPNLAQQTLAAAVPLTDKFPDFHVRQTLKRRLQECTALLKDTPPPRTAPRQPKVSVVIPCYKQADFLPEAVASVLAQTLSDWEIIIVNDGSPDHTSTVANRLIAQYPNRRIRLVEKANGGLPSARNAGFRAAHGQYVLPLDADDKIKPTLLAKLTAILDERPEVGWAYTDIHHFGDLNTEWRLPDFDRHTLVSKDNICICCALCRKAMWEQVGGYNEAMREGYEDWDFWVSCVEHSWVGYCLHEPLFQYRKHGHTMVTDSNKKRPRLMAQIVLNHPKLYDAATLQSARAVIANHVAAEPAGSTLTSGSHTAISVAAERPRLRISYLISSILGVTGGNQTLLRQAEEMRRRGHDVTIVTYTPKPEWFRFETRVIQAPAGQPLAQFVPPSDVVVATYLTNAPELLAIKAGVKIYYAQGDQFVFADDTMALTEQNQKFRELSHASYLLPGVRFVPNSHNLANAVQTLCGRTPDGILPVCTDQTIFRPLQRSLPGSRFRLLIVGPDARGTEAEPLLFKGIQDTHDALKLLAERYPHFTAVRMSATAPDIFARFPCEFYIAPSDEMKTVLFGTSHIHIYASHYDSCPRPPQEAMAAGCAVVCTATPGAMEYCRDGENALLVPVKSPKAIATAVERLIKDHALRDQLVKGGLATAGQFPREREWNEWETLLYRFVDESAAPKTTARISVASHPSKPAAAPAKAAPLKLPACARLGHLAAAREFFQKKNLRQAWDATLAALKLRPFHPEAFLLLAEIAGAAGDGETARLCAEHARRLAPDWKPARQFLNRRLKGGAHPSWLVLPEALKPATAGAAPRLSVCLIVKNEERFLSQCLESVRGLAHQIVVVDTGSTDRTVELAKAQGAEVHHFDWCDDFSAARNAALERVTGDWVLVLDADEELSAEGREKLGRHLEDASVMGWRLPMVDVGREAEGRSFVPRLFRNAPGLFYVGRVHEQVFSSIEVRRAEWKLESRLGEALLIHHGYTAEITRDRNKVQRNLALLEQAIQELPNEPHLLMNLGLELGRAGKEAEALERYREAFEALAANAAAQAVPELRETLLTQFCTRLAANKAFEEVVRVLTSTVAQANGGLNASLHFALGLAQLELGRHLEAAEQFQHCLAKRNQPTLSPRNKDIATAAPFHCLALCQARAGNREAAEKAFQQGLSETGNVAKLRLDYARFLAESNRPVEGLQRLHEVVAENTQDLAAWRLGGVIVLSRPEFLEFARDWTSEALQQLPADDVLKAQRAEALLLSQQPAPAAGLWEDLWRNDRKPQALAALMLCELAAGSLEHLPQNEAEAAATGRAFLEWYRKCLAFGARDFIVKLHANAAELRRALPEVARIIEQVVAEVGHPEELTACAK